VRFHLKESDAIEKYRGIRVTAQALQREAERITAATRFPDRLAEIARALADDPFLFQECFVRPALVDRLARSFLANDQRFTRPRFVAMAAAISSSHRPPGFHLPGVPDLLDFPLAEKGRRALPSVAWDAWWTSVEAALDERNVAPVTSVSATIPLPSAAAAVACPDDLWQNGGLVDLPDGRFHHPAVWTGAVMIDWDGTGAIYDPATDIWPPVATATANAPSSALGNSVVWTGSRMIVWGGADVFGLDTGGRYDPLTDSEG
jgi:hypothetical protein